MADGFASAEFGVDGEGRLNLFGWADAGDEGPPGSPWDEEVDAGWDPGDHLDAWEDRGDDEEAWLASLPPDLRAEVEARPPAIAPWAGAGEVRAGFADGGFFDTMLPGAALADMLATATEDGFAGLSDDELTGVLRGWARQVGHDQASLACAVQALSGRRAAGSSRAAEHVADELAAELTLTGRSSARLLELAAGLERLTVVRDALLSGFVDWPRACVFVDELAVLDDAAAAGIAERLVDAAAGWTTGQLRAALARAVLQVDPAAAERRKKTARIQTRVELWREGSGNAALAGRELRPASAIQLDKKLTCHAQWLAACGVPGTLEELRALAYTTLLAGRDLDSLLPADSGDGSRGGNPDGTRAGQADGAASGGGDGARTGNADRARIGNAGRAQAGNAAGGGPWPGAGSIHLTMPVSAFAGGGEPGEVAGHGPVDAGISRELAAFLTRDPATRWCLTLTGPGGHAVAHACARRGPAPGEPVITWTAGLRERLLTLEAGTCRHAREAAGYVPPPRLRHLIIVRQRRCAFPGVRHEAPCYRMGVGDLRRRCVAAQR